MIGLASVSPFKAVDMKKLSIRMLHSAAGMGPTYRKGEVIDDAPAQFMRSAVRTGIAEWVVSPSDVEEEVKNLPIVQPKRKRRTKKK